MDSNKSFYRSIDFWIISFIYIVSIFYACLCEIFPTDWFLSSQTYKKDPQYLYQKRWNRLLISTQSKQYLSANDYFEDPEKLFEKTIHIFKNKEKKTKVALVEINNFRYVVKKFNVPSFFYWLKAIPIRASKAFRSWHYGIKLHHLGIPTPSPILLVENRVGPFWTSSYIVTPYIPGNTAYEYFNIGSSYEEYWPEIMAKINKTLENMNQHLIIHGDLSLNNIIIDKGQPYLIDLDRVHFYHYDHTFYARRRQSQHISKLSRKLNELNSKAQFIFLDSQKDRPNRP